MKRIIVIIFALMFVFSFYLNAQENKCSGWYVESKTVVPWEKEHKRSVEEITIFARSVPDCDFGFFSNTRIKMWKNYGEEKRTIWFESVVGFSILPVDYFSMNIGVGTENELWRVFASSWLGNDYISLSGFISGGGSEMWCKTQLMITPLPWVSGGAYYEYKIGVGPKLEIKIPKTPVSFSGSLLFNTYKERDENGYTTNKIIGERNYMFTVRITF